MKKSISNPLKKLYAFLTVPALALYLIACSEKEFVAQAPQRDNKSGIDSLNEFNVFLVSRSKTTGNPLYKVDGKEISTLQEISPDNIKSITVLKDDTAMTLYGEKGRNGVVVITTKEGSQKNDHDISGKNVQVEQTTGVSTLPVRHRDNSPITVNHLLSIRGNSQTTTNPLWVIDGKEVSTLEDIKPEDIENITVLKDETAKTIYGEKGKNGVILITTKAANREN